MHSLRWSIVDRREKAGAGVGCQFAAHNLVVEGAVVAQHQMAAPLARHAPFGSSIPFAEPYWSVQVLLCRTFSKSVLRYLGAWSCFVLFLVFVVVCLVVLLFGAVWLSCVVSGEGLAQAQTLGTGAHRAPGRPRCNATVGVPAGSVPVHTRLGTRACHRPTIVHNTPSFESSAATSWREVSEAPRVAPSLFVNQ
jgi:hypothetical protein